mmetsp:Transcript_70556/g.183084  ORF Transcript_70556/g.183084 Transcript_70556/m.183084 type:complete len:249 (+) Transcript_70556:220-966(+)
MTLGNSRVAVSQLALEGFKSCNLGNFCLQRGLTLAEGILQPTSCNQRLIMLLSKLLQRHLRCLVRLLALQLARILLLELRLQVCDALRTLPGLQGLLLQTALETGGLCLVLLQLLLEHPARGSCLMRLMLEVVMFGLELLMCTFNLLPQLLALLQLLLEHPARGSCLMRLMLEVVMFGLELLMCTFNLLPQLLLSLQLHLQALNSFPRALLRNGMLLFDAIQQTFCALCHCSQFFRCALLQCSPLVGS